MLDLVEAAEGGMTVAEVAAATGAHANTAREHLDALMQSGHVVRAQMPAVGRGRPAMIYRAVREPAAVGSEYAVLAELLVAHLQRNWPDPADQAEQARLAGEQWIAGGGEERRRRVFGSEIDPEPVAGSHGERDGHTIVRMRRCPVLDLARTSPDVVCSIHRGMIQGAVPPEVRAKVVLSPFAEAGACVVRLPAVPGFRGFRTSPEP